MLRREKECNYFCPAAPGLGKDLCVSADSCKASGTFGILFLRVLFIALTYFKHTILLLHSTKC